MSFSSWLDFNFGDEFDFYHMMDEQYWIQAGLVPDDHPRIKLVNQLCLSHSISSTLIAIISQHFFLQREVAQCITSYTNPLANFSSSSGKASKIINPYGVPSAIDRLIQQVRPVPDIESVHMSLLGWFESLNKRYQCFTKISDFVNGPHLLSPTILTHLHDGAIFVDIMFLATLARLHAVNHRSANSAFQFLVSSSSPVTSSSSSITTTGGTAAGGPLSTPSSTSLFDSKEYLTKATSCDIILLASFALTSILATGVSVDQSPASTEFIYSVLKRNQVAKAIAIIMDALICVLESEVGWAKMDDAKNLTLDAMCNLYLPILSSAANGGNGSVMMDYTALSASVSRFTVALQHHHHQQQQEQTKQNGEGDNFVNFCMMDTALELEESGVLRAS